MKRLSGGAVLLNLTDISLGITSGEVTISDAGVLGELTELRNFIDTQRDFSKGFKSLKPVLVEYRSSASKFNGIALANLSFNTDALHMSIGVNTIQADGKMLVITINVVYAWSDYIGYTISSAKLNAYETLATGDGTFTGDVGVGGDLEVTGDATFGGDTSGIKIEDLVDKAGNKRFIEDDINIETISGVSKSYGKWSLSGSHLMLVLQIVNTTESDINLVDWSRIGMCALPQYVLDKIVPIPPSSHIMVKQFDGCNDELTFGTNPIKIYLDKGESGLNFNVWSSTTLEAGLTYRIEFDLLIDDEYE